MNQYVLIYLVAINLIAFLAMLIDKRKAKMGDRRTKEATLFTFVFMGGWIGGIAGMYVFRHKTKKPLFVVGFPAIAILQIALVIAIVTM
ncbi:MAG: DUF1294 domain-containing protein [Oscillospiraceae bacterium]|nr:DUF1294 domain-containing protein [Oscillospiraceae bacterium]